MFGNLEIGEYSYHCAELSAIFMRYVREGRYSSTNF